MKSRIGLQAHMAQRTEFVTTFEEASTNAKPLMRELQKVPQRVRQVLESIQQQEVFFLTFMLLIKFPGSLS